MNSNDFTYLLISFGIPDDIYHIPDIVNSELSIHLFTRFDAGRFMMRAISEFSSSSSKLKESLISSAAPSSSSVSFLSFSGD